MANEKDGERIRVDTDGGKYTFIMRENGSTHALRYGKPWLENIGSLPGSNMIASLAHDLDEARAEILRLRRLAIREVGVSNVDIVPKGPVNTPARGQDADEMNMYNPGSAHGRDG